MNSIEQELMMMLRRLPVPIIITWRGGLYHWQCGQDSGVSPHAWCPQWKARSALCVRVCCLDQTPRSRQA